MRQPWLRVNSKYQVHRLIGGEKEVRLCGEKEAGNVDTA